MQCFNRRFCVLLFVLFCDVLSCLVCVFSFFALMLARLYAEAFVPFPVHFFLFTQLCLNPCPRLTPFAFRNTNLLFAWCMNGKNGKRGTHWRRSIFSLCKTEKDWLGFFEETGMEVRDIWTYTGMGWMAHTWQREMPFFCVHKNILRWCNERICLSVFKGPAKDARIQIAVRNWW